MRKIADIYQEYKIMPNLQLHQIRVAAVAKQISDSIKITSDTKSIIIACLLHDMGNIVKSKLGYFKEFTETQSLEYWQNIQKEFIEKYGIDDHEATRKIIQEIGLPSKTLLILEKCLDHAAKENIESFDIPSSICKYADTRIGPHGVMPLRERLEEWQKRDEKITPEYMEMTYSIFHSVEQKIFAHSNIKPEDITDESIADDVQKLKEFSF